MRGLILLALVVPTIAAGNCYSIKDPDMRNYCKATEGGNVSYCYSIKDPDYKNLCKAKVDNLLSSCYAIKDENLRNLCKAQVK